MNNNTRHRRAEVKGSYQPRKSFAPKVGRSADAIMRKLGTGKYAKGRSHVS
jgi:hypothetical protein